MPEKPIAVITARMGSGRLPGKVLLPLAGKTVLEHLIDRIRHARLFDTIVLATSAAPANQPLADLAQRYDIHCHRGAEDDVLDRYVQILREHEAANLCRFCADNPLTDMETTARLVELHLARHLDYTCVKGLQLQLGLVEVYSRAALEIEHQQTDPADNLRRESVGIFLREHPDIAAINALRDQKAGNLYWQQLDAKLP